MLHGGRCTAAAGWAAAARRRSSDIGVGISSDSSRMKSTSANVPASTSALPNVANARLTFCAFSAAACAEALQRIPRHAPYGIHHGYSVGRERAAGTRGGRAETAQHSATLPCLRRHNGSVHVSLTGGEDRTKAPPLLYSILFVALRFGFEGYRRAGAQGDAASTNGRVAGRRWGGTGPPTCGCACKCHRLQMKTCRACAGGRNARKASVSQRRCCDSAERSQPRLSHAAASPRAFGGPVPCARSGRAQQPGERLGSAVRSAEGLGSQAVGLGYLRTAELRADVLLEGGVRVVAAAVAPKAAAEHVGLRHGLQRAAGSGRRRCCIMWQHGVAWCGMRHGPAEGLEYHLEHTSMKRAQPHGVPQAVL